MPRPALSIHSELALHAWRFALVRPTFNGQFSWKLVHRRFAENARIAWPDRITPLQEQILAEEVIAESPAFTLFGNLVRADNESLWSGANKIEWITGYQGQDCVIGIVEHLRVLRRDHLGGIHKVVIGAIQRRQRDFVVMVDIAERPEKCIPMPRDPGVPMLPR